MNREELHRLAESLLGPVDPKSQLPGGTDVVLEALVQPRPLHLGLGAKFVPHNKESTTAEAIAKRLKGKVMVCSG